MVKDLRAMDRREAGKTIVGHPDVNLGAVYDFDAEKAGMPGFYTGAATIYMGGTVIRATASARGLNRAVAMAMHKAADAILALFPPEIPT